MAGAVALAPAALAGPADASAGMLRLGAAPSLPAGARISGSLPATTSLRVTVALNPRDPAALASFATEVSTPGSSVYRDYITPAQFAQRFGAAPAQVDAVEASLRAHGLTPGPVSANSLSIPVTATAGQLASAFSVSFSRVRLADGQSAIANEQAPALDTAVAPDVQAVVGLDTLSRPTPLLVRPHETQARSTPHVITGGPEPCPTASQAAATEGAYTADQIASAYGFAGLYAAGDEGAGQTIAAFELEGYDPNDIAAYQQCFGTDASVTPVQVDGGPGPGSGPPGSGEAALDIEDLIGLAPEARILVYEGPNNGVGVYDTWSAIVSQRAAQVVTASWGQCEPIEGHTAASAENVLFEEAATQGQSIMSASGDDGSEDCFPYSNELAVDDPSSQPFVTGVGGTSLTALGPRPSELVWNNGVAGGASGGAGGGGTSSLWPMPAYQANAPSSLHVIGSDSSGSDCGSSMGYCREDPDVSADADPNTGYMIYWNGSGDATGLPRGWQAVGGTSAAAPVWAALIALANVSAGCAGSDIGFANPDLYSVAGVSYASYFNDVTSGDNDFTGTGGGHFPAGPGYDMATGLGSPNGAALAAALCRDTVTVQDPGAQHSVLKSAVSVQLKGSDNRGAALTYSATGLPSGLSIKPTTGRISGHPKKLGASTVTITAHDAAGTLGRTSFVWTIDTAPTVTHASLTGIPAARPKLSFTLTAGRDAPPIEKLTVALPSGLRFTRHRATVTLTGSRGRHLKFTVTLAHGVLALKLRAAASQERATIAYPQLAVSDTLKTLVARREVTSIKVRVSATDASKTTTQIVVRIPLAR